MTKETGLRPENTVSELHRLSLFAIVKLLKKKELTVKELLECYLQRLEEDERQPRESRINAVVYKNKEEALKQAANAPADSLLGGAPIIIKENLHLLGYPVRCASKILSNYKATYSSTAMLRLLKNGASIFATANMDEFAMGSANENSMHGFVCNPLAKDYIPGGSSGGPAAAVAGYFTSASIGSDTGGSIRQPAACCGVIGLKPTYGRVSRYGLVAFASSFDQIGPIARRVEDIALLLEAMAGHDEADSTSAKLPVPSYSKALETPIKNLHIALPKEYLGDTVHPQIRRAFMQAVDFYEKQGAKISEVSLPNTDYALSIYYILSTAEASSNLARFDGIRYGNPSKKAENLSDLFFRSRSEGFGDEVKRRIFTGSYVLSAGYYDDYYMKALKARRVVYDKYMAILKDADLLMMPTLPYRVFKRGKDHEDPTEMYRSDVFNVAANVVGLPSMSLPCAKDSLGLPISFQFMGRPFDEALMLRAAYLYQQEHGLPVFENAK